MTAPPATGSIPAAPEPWGRWRPNALEHILIDACRRLPEGWWARRLRVLLRRPVKYGKETPLDVEVWGLRLRLHRRGNFSETQLLTFPDGFDPVEREILRDSLRPGAVFFDIGANAGAYSFWVASVLHGDCTIVTVEPDPELYERVAFNLSQNALGAIRLHNAAVGGEAGRAKLTINPAVRGQNSLLGVPGASGLRTVDVDVWPLRQLVETHRCDRIDAMKVDIEGMEEATLIPFFETTAPALWPRLLILESKETDESLPLRDRVERLGYRVLRRSGFNLVFVLETASPPPAAAS